MCLCGRRGVGAVLSWHGRVANLYKKSQCRRLAGDVEWGDEMRWAVEPVILFGGARAIASLLYLCSFSVLYFTRPSKTQAVFTATVRCVYSTHFHDLMQTFDLDGNVHTFRKPFVFRYESLIDARIRSSLSGH